MIKVKYWLWLTMVFGVGNERLWDVMEYFDDPVIAYGELCRGQHKLELNEKEKENINIITIEKCSRIIEICNSKGVGIAGYSSPEYPQYLRHIYNPPAILFYKGNIDILNQVPAVTIVGTRKASAQSLMTAERLSRELAQNGFIIASGFAVGIDITSHMAAANVNCPTVCVMGCGIDVNYPKENVIYRESILKNNGVFVTEFFPGTTPFPHNFPKRNRILSGISRAVVIIEAGNKSGSLITAELALEQGREVFCVPPANIYDPRYSGNIKFLRDGACPIYGYEDIACYFNLFSEQILAEAKYRLNIDDEDENSDESLNNEEYEEDKENYSEKAEKISKRLDEFSDIQQKILKILIEGENYADIIAEELGFDMNEIMLEITELELEGIVKSMPRNKYGLK